MKIFISYSSQSRPLVEALADDLELIDCQVWFDRKLTGGQDWWEAILGAIRDCDVFLFALTPQTLQSYPCSLEYQYAVDLRRLVLPVQLEDIKITDLPRSLQRIQLVDYRQQSKAQLVELKKSLRNLPATLPLPQPLPPAPAAPLSPLSQLQDDINKAKLTGDEQRLIVARLEELLEDDPGEARQLLAKLRHHPDLIVALERKITRLLDPVALNPTDKSFAGHTQAVTSVAFSLTGKAILTASHDASARLLSLPTGELIHTFSHGDSPVNVGIFSPDGHSVLTGNDSAVAYLWDIATGKQLSHYKGHQSLISSAAFSPEGKTVVTGSYDNSAIIWATLTGEILHRLAGHKDAVHTVAFAPNGSLIATGSSDGTVALWKAATGQGLQVLKTPAPIFALAFSPDGKQLLTGGEDGTARLWEVASGRLAQQITGYTTPIFSVAFAPGYFVAAGNDGIAHLWDAKTGKELHQFKGHGDSIYSAAFSLDGRYLLTGSADCTARLWALDNLA